MKHILLGVTGGIAAYKMLDVASKLRKHGHTVNTILTANACEFVTPLAFETITSNYVITDTFSKIEIGTVEHIEMAKKIDLLIIAPATANTIGKIAHGIADDMLTTTILAVRAPVIIAPAMNSRMYDNIIVQNNLEYLKSIGYIIMEPEVGNLACGETGKGKLPSPDDIVAFINEQLKIIDVTIDTPNDLDITSTLNVQNNIYTMQQLAQNYTVVDTPNDLAVSSSITSQKTARYSKSNAVDIDTPNDLAIHGTKETQESRVYEPKATDLETNKDLAGLKMVITAGRTIEPIDPMRYLSNNSTGKMGYEVAQAAAKRGANVILISGPTQLECPNGVTKVDVKTADEMYNKVD